MSKSIYKRLLPPILAETFILAKNSNSRALHQLNSYPRFTDGKISLSGNEIYFQDSASLISTYSEIFEDEVFKFNSQNDEPFIIDLGANIGLSVIYFKRIYPKARIIAVEADTAIFRYLEKNINNLDLKDVRLINKAVYDSNTVVPFYSEGADGGRIEASSKRTTEITTIDILEIIPDNIKVDMLKIDIEGSEAKVLSRCQDRLDLVENIFIEYHSAECKNPQELSGILKVLENNNFRYTIQHVYPVRSPFINNEKSLNGFDLQLEIFAQKNNVKKKRNV
jgi:FkbM family methyltransferase